MNAALFLRLAWAPIGFVLKENVWEKVKSGEKKSWGNEKKSSEPRYYHI